MDVVIELTGCPRGLRKYHSRCRYLGKNLKHYPINGCWATNSIFISAMVGKINGEEVNVFKTYCVCPFYKNKKE